MLASRGGELGYAGSDESSCGNSSVCSRRADLCPHSTRFQKSVKKYLMNSFSFLISKSMEMRTVVPKLGPVEKDDGISPGI